MNLFYKGIIIFLLIINTIAGFSQMRPDNANTIKIAEGEKQAFRQKTLKSNKSIGCNYDVKYHRFNWYIDPDILYIKGCVTTYFTATKDTVKNISFELSDALTVDSVISHNKKLIIDHSANDELIIYLGNRILSGTLDSVTIYYQGVPPQDTQGFGSFVKATHGTNPSHPIIWTLSEPYGAKDWWPCKQSLNDKVDSIDLIVTTPKQYRVASNGLLVNETEQGNDKIYHWKHRYPIAAYLIAIAVTNYAVYSDWVPLTDGKSLQVLNYVYHEDSTVLRGQTALTVPFIQIYTKLFTPYPFIKEKYGHAEFNWGGGMEHQTMTFMGYFQFEITSHELAHQWFGDDITTGNWHDLWLNEGFATYLSGLCYEQYFPDHYYWNLWKKQKIGSITSLPNGSVYVKDTANQNVLFNSRLTYNKGGMILHSLRWIVGDSNFYHALRNYLNDKKLSYGYAINNDLKTHFEAASGMDLKYYFDDWYYGEGYPTYDVKVVENSDNTLSVTLNQTTSDKSVSFFKLPVPVEFKGKNNDTIIRFDNTYSGQSFIVNPGFKVDSVKCDPDSWLIAHYTTSLTVGVKDINIDSRILISPNPAQNTCNIISNGLKIEKIEVRDMTGRIDLQEFYNVDHAVNSITIDISNLDKSIYVIKVFTNKGIISRKLIKL